MAYEDLAQTPTVCTTYEGSRVSSSEGVFDRMPLLTPLEKKLMTWMTRAPHGRHAWDQETGVLADGGSYAREDIWVDIDPKWKGHIQEWLSSGGDPLTQITRRMEETSTLRPGSDIAHIADVVLRTGLGDCVSRFMFGQDTHLNCIEQMAAVSWLAHHFPGRTGIDVATIIPYNDAERQFPLSCTSLIHDHYGMQVNVGETVYYLIYGGRLIQVSDIFPNGKLDRVAIDNLKQEILTDYTELRIATEHPNAEEAERAMYANILHADAETYADIVFTQMLRIHRGARQLQK